MGKTGTDFDPEGYAPVAERIRLFYHDHPFGRIETELVRRTQHEVVFKALVFRDANDAHPAATGWAAEREGDGDVNLVACLENTETSAIGRALANLGFTAARERPSAEEMAKASRVRARVAVRSVTSREAPKRVVAEVPLLRPTVYRAATASSPYDDSVEPTTSTLRDEITGELLRLLDRAERLGARRERMRRWRMRLLAGSDDEATLARYRHRLRSWIAKRLGH